MEIKIKTIDEFRSERITIEVAPGQRAEIEIVDGKESNQVYDPEKAAEVLAQINGLEAELSRRASVIKKLENKVEGYDTDRHTERDRADRITREHSWCAGMLELREKDADTFRRQRNDLEAQVKDLEEGRAADHREIVTLRGRAAELTRCIDNARVILTATEVTEAQRTDCTRTGTTMSAAILKAVDTLS